MPPLRASTKEALASMHKPEPQYGVMEWAATSVDYARVPSYETELKAAYDPEYFPFWEEPAEAIRNRTIREQWILKATRTGCSENVLFTPIRYCVAKSPRHILYVTGSIKSLESAAEKRIKDGMGLSDETAKAFAAARTREHEVYFHNMDLICGWNTDRNLYKGRGYQYIAADEISVWADYSVDMLRERTSNFAFSLITGISSPDPKSRRSSDDDPIFVAYNQGDQRKWHVPYPNGQWHTLIMGTRDGAGLQWDQSAKNKESGEWDLDRVRASARYRLPDGTLLTTREKNLLVRKGRWIPGNPNAPEGVRSYHLNAFYSPMTNGDLGEIACKFLKAQSSPQARRAFTYEVLAEPWYEEIEQTPVEVIYDRESGLSKGSSITTWTEYAEKQPLTILTIDTQKYHFWWVKREWFDPGDSNLLGWGVAATWEELETLSKDCYQVFIDARYRQLEVYENCLHRQLIPLLGSDNTNLPMREHLVDPYQGSSKAGSAGNILTITWSTDQFRTILQDALNGQSARAWYVYKGIEREYVQHLSSMARIDGKWDILSGRGGRKDLYDCEAMQIVGAARCGCYRTFFQTYGEETSEKRT